MVARVVTKRLKALDGILNSARPKSVIERLAIQRQIEDLRTGHKRGLVWDEDEASRAVAFFPLLRHWKGSQWSGKPMILEPWQEHCIVAPMFGWYRQKTREAGGFRRFRTAYIEIPRKNGKTTIASGLANQGLIADREPGAEVYCAATKRDQAAILFKDAQQSLGLKLKPLVNVFRSSIVCPKWQSTLQVLSADYNSLDGLNLHRGIIDELHAHKQRNLFDVLLTAMGARQHPMLVAITTAGYDRSTICWEQREETRNILEGHKENDAFFGFVTTCDDGDDWQDPQTWWKANPNLYVSLNEDYLRDLCITASDSPGAENNFRRKHLDQWTQTETSWLPLTAWDACKESFTRADLRGRKCFVGIDLSSTRDVTAVVLLFPFEDGTFKVLPFFWIPEESSGDRQERDRRQVLNWAERRLIATCEGNSIDYQQIADAVMDMAREFDIEQLVFDPWGPAQAFVQMLTHAGFDVNKMAEFRQTLANFASPMKLAETLILQQKLRHDGNPVLRWMFGNVAVKPDVNDNIRPDKSKSADKIDGLVAMVMSLAAASAGESSRSYYEDHDLLIL